MINVVLFVQRDMENKKSEEEELKHLGFVKIAAMKALVCVSNLYGFAKQNSGLLRSAVGTVEDTVTTVLGPVYHKFNAVPNHILLFVDNKVSFSLSFIKIYIFCFCCFTPSTKSVKACNLFVLCL